MGVEIAHEFALLVAGRYPTFVYRDLPSADRAAYIPVFTFHSLDPVDFEDKLRYIDANGYRTITVTELTAWMGGRGAAPPKAVVLTIDDGRLSTWTVGLPLLRKYGMVATAFVVPGYLGEGRARPTLEDVWAGDLDIDRIAATEGEDRTTVLTWSEVEAMHRSGVIAIESHTMLHRRVFVSPRVVGFISPDRVDSMYEVPLPIDVKAGWTTDALRQHLGAPLFQHAPVMSARRAYEVPPTLWEECARIVRSAGGEEFFRRPDWQRTLRCRVRATGPHRPRAHHTRALQEWELRRSKEVLEERLAGKTVRHLCYPNSLGSARTAALSAQAGYDSNLWGLLDAATTNRAGADPFCIGRLKHDYVYRLPGDGRRPLSQVLWLKAVRRFRKEKGF